MYPNILLSALVFLISGRIIGGILKSPKWIKACQIAMVLLVCGAVIAWLLAGLNPLPEWPVRLFRRLVHEVSRLAA